jgi:predicted deacylase
MRRIISALLSLAILASLAACAAPDEFRITAVDEANLGFFRDTWEEARSQFLDLSAQTKQRIPESESGILTVPSTLDGELPIDWLYVPAAVTQSKLVIVSSGVHGPEGFPGSAVQALMLREYLPTAQRETTAFLFLHGINAYGMKHDRRFTENNVDLNRNAPISPSVYTTANSGYAGLDSFLNPTGQVNLASLADSTFTLRMGLQVLTKGKSNFSQASLGGQYQFPKGIFYGGSAAEPQYVELEELITRVLERYNLVVGIDLHSGVGRRSYMHLMPNPSSGDEYKKTVELLFANHPLEWPDAPGGDFYQTNGDFTTWIETLAQPRQAVAMTVEFGTLDSQTTTGAIRSMRTMITENQGHWNGYARAEDELRVKEDVREMFFPSSRVWRSEVIRQARETLFNTLKLIEVRP